MRWRHRTGVSVLVLAVAAVGATPLFVRQAMRSFLAGTLDFTDRAAQYADAPFSAEEAAGVSLLTSLGAVEGYGDGTFRPGDTLNRAEFLKIVLKSSHRSVEVSLRPARCFPDVRRDDWFSPFVCFGKEQGIIAGYPDGLFRPGNPVNHAEALKILVELYGYSRTAVAQDVWFSPYARAAHERGVFLLADLPLDAPLTRGQMARLAAAFRAEADGELTRYLDKEDGEDDVPSPSGGGVPARTIPFGSGGGRGVEEVPLPSGEEDTKKLRSRQILLGTKSPAIAAAIIKNEQNNAEIRAVRILLEQKVTSLKSVLLRNAMEQEIAVLRVRTDDMEERRNWIAEFSGADARSLPAGREERFSLAAELTERGKGGIPGELLRIHRVVFTLFDPVSGVSWESVHDGPFPVHQTVQARLDQIEQRGESGPLTEGIDRLLGTFAFAGTIPPETDLRLVELLIRMRAEGVDVTKWRLRRGSIAMECFRTYGEDTLLTCPGIPVEIGRLTEGQLVLELRGDVKRTGNVTAPFLELSLASAGKPGENGALRWTDGSKEYNWVDLPGPLTENARWTLGP